MAASFLPFGSCSQTQLCLASVTMSRSPEPFDIHAFGWGEGRRSAPGGRGRVLVVDVLIGVDDGFGNAVMVVVNGGGGADLLMVGAVLVVDGGAVALGRLPARGAL